VRRRVRQLVRLVGPIVIAIVVAAAAGSAAIYLTAPDGLISCVPAATPASPDPIPRWVIAAGIPARVGAVVGSFFALGAKRVLARLIGLVLVAVLAGGTFYAVYALLPAACRL
jgi:hypothetical protein